MKERKKGEKGERMRREEGGGGGGDNGRDDHNMKGNNREKNLWRGQTIFSLHEKSQKA